MINTLRLTNMRRHVNTVIDLQGTEHLILLSGANGTGKSTIVEAIVYAFYGESRHGRRKLDRMITRGFEVDGMEVECTFTLDQTEYRVIRRRDGRMSSAVLYGNGTPIVESSRGVTQHIEKLYGMDAQGFRLAVVAQQKELDSLSSLTPGVRKQQIARLLRLDVVTAARDTARKDHNQLTTTLTALGDRVDEAALAEHLDTLQNETNVLTKTSKAQQKALRKTRTSLDAAEEAAQNAQQVLQQAAAYNATVESGQAGLSALIKQQTELEPVPTPIVAPAITDSETIAKKRRDLEHTIGAAISKNAIIDQQKAVADQIVQDKARLEQIRTAVTNLATASDVAGATEQVAAADTHVVEAQTRLEAVRQDHHSVRTSVRNLATQIKRAGTLDSSCDRCGQGITDEHVHTFQTSLQEDLDEANNALSSQAGAVADAEKALKDITRHATESKQTEVSATKQFNERVSLEGEIQRLEQRIRTIKMPSDSTKVDIGSLEGERDVLAGEEQALLQYQQLTALKRSHDDLAERIQSSSQQVVAAVKQAEAVDCAAAQSTIETVALLRADAQSAEQLLGETNVAVAVHETSVAQVKDAIDDAVERNTQRDSTSHDTEVLAASSRVLSDLRDHLAAEARPTLTGAVSEVLASLSGGRFTRVRFTDDYDLEIDDAGVWSTISELSGGETDLVALATRLGLAAVVSERHGSGGAGFLILDECFGSQDPQRRLGILEGLRNLSGVYRQIILISHVPGIDSHVDKELNVTLDADGFASVEAMS